MAVTIETHDRYSDPTLQHAASVDGSRAPHLQELALGIDDITRSVDLPVLFGKPEHHLSTGPALRLPPYISIEAIAPKTVAGLIHNESDGFYAPFGIQLAVDTQARVIHANYPGINRALSVVYADNAYHHAHPDSSSFSPQASKVIGALIAADDDQIPQAQEEGIIILESRPEIDAAYHATAIAVPKSALKPKARDTIVGPDDALYVFDPLNLGIMSQQPWPFVDNFRPVAVVSNFYISALLLSR